MFSTSPKPTNQDQAVSRPKTDYYSTEAAGIAFPHITVCAGHGCEGICCDKSNDQKSNDQAVSRSQTADPLPDYSTEAVAEDYSPAFAFPHITVCAGHGCEGICCDKSNEQKSKDRKSKDQPVSRPHPHPHSTAAKNTEVSLGYYSVENAFPPGSMSFPPGRMSVKSRKCCECALS